MSDLVERVARAMALQANDYDGPVLQWQCWVDSAKAALATMQTDAAPALKPAVEVWRDAADASNSPVPCDDADCLDCLAAAAVIEADRAAIITAKDVEIAALQAHADALAGKIELLHAMLIDNDYDFGEAVEGFLSAVEPALRPYKEFHRG